MVAEMALVKDGRAVVFGQKPGELLGVDHDGLVLIVVTHDAALLLRPGPDVDDLPPVILRDAGQRGLAAAGRSGQGDPHHGARPFSAGMSMRPRRRCPPRPPMRSQKPSINARSPWDRGRRS